MPEPDEVQKIHQLDQNREAVLQIATFHALFYNHLISDGVPSEAAVALTAAYFQSSMNRGTP